MQELVFEAKQLCRHQHSGVLGTISTSMPGYPFGSVVPYVLTHEGNAIIYISDIALHTRNIKADSKVSLTIHDGTQDDSQSNGRVTIMGNAALAEDQEKAAELYFNMVPQAKAYQKTHDFNFYQITTERVRYIGGFGKIHWLNKEYWLNETQPWHQQTQGMIEHMNDDHQDAMQVILEAEFGITPASVEMFSVFAEGAHYRTPDDVVYYVPFDTPVKEGADVRKQLVKQTHGAREQLGRIKEKTNTAEEAALA